MNNDSIINILQFLKYDYILKILEINNNNIDNNIKHHILMSINKKANTIIKFFKYTHNIFKNIDQVELKNTKLMGLYYFKNYEKEYASEWIIFPCSWKFNIIKKSSYYINIMNEKISDKYKLFKIQQNLTLQEIAYIGW